MREWHEGGLEPSFAAVDDWIIDQLGRLQAEELAAYAIEERPDLIRIVLVTDRGLADYRWQRSDDPAERSVHGRLYAWWEVAGLVLEGETRLVEGTLLRDRPRWSMRLEVPELAIDSTGSEEAVLGLWGACHEQLAAAHHHRSSGR